MAKLWREVAVISDISICAHLFYGRHSDTPPWQRWGEDVIGTNVRFGSFFFFVVSFLLCGMLHDI